MNQNPIPRHSNPVIVTQFKEGFRTYERRYVDCGKTSCHRCTTPTGRVASHGPYWYLCFPRRGKWFRIYLGKTLDTSRYITPKGSIDWPAIRAKRKSKSHDEAPSGAAPGQDDFISPQPSSITETQKPQEPPSDPPDGSPPTP